ncbi:hypothetical protein LEMLEM_LOCUS16288, partial [Lemmus lemmus]
VAIVRGLYLSPLKPPGKGGWTACGLSTPHPANSSPRQQRHGTLPLFPARELGQMVLEAARASAFESRSYSLQLSAWAHLQMTQNNRRPTYYTLSAREQGWG